ncbi:MAG TPA: ABC transporter permease [Gemmatimonadaceae bacterium]|jgi:phospholipid/cholesterol/gamma-HCH transport system permease protein
MATAALGERLITRPAPPPSHGRAFVEGLGRHARLAVETVGRTGKFTAHTVRAFREVETWRPRVVLQARRLGVDSLPIGLFIAVFTGIVLALLASYSFTGAVPLYFVGTLVQKTITMELAPVLTGLALAGRVGANIAAEIGTMRVTEQIDALETLTYDPLAYLVIPRVIAGAAMFPVVVGMAMLAGMVAGWGASLMLLDVSSAEFIKGARLFFSTFDVRYGLVKAASFGAAVTLVGCMSGMEVRGGAEGVGRGATRAVVWGAMMILVLDAFWAVTWLLGRTP